MPKFLMVVMVVLAVVVAGLVYFLGEDRADLVARCGAQGMSPVALGRAGSVCVAPDGALYIPRPR